MRKTSAKCQVLTAAFFHLEQHDGVRVLRLQSNDGTNRLTQACVLALTEAFRDLARNPEPMIVTGNRKFFSAGADLSRDRSLNRARSVRILSNRPDADEYGRAFPSACLRGNLWILHGRWTRSGVSPVTSESLRRRDFRTSGCCSRPDHRLGRNTTLTAFGGKGKGAGDVCGRREGTRPRCVELWADRCNGGGPCGGGSKAH